MDCYVCGYPLPEGANFCPNCGRNRHAAPSVPETELLPLDPVPEEEAILPEQEAPEMPGSEPEETNSERELTPEAPAPEFPEEPAEQEPPRKKRRPLLVPGLILAGMFLGGLVCFFLFPYQTVHSADPSTPAVRDPENPALPSLPGNGSDSSQSRSEDFVPADERCFELREDGLRFLPEKYDGGKVLVIPNEIGGVTVTAIADYGFADLEDITTVILPDGREAIGAYAFAGCGDLRGVYIPSGVNSIGANAFEWCVSLESISISTGVKSIGTDAFDGCASLMYIFYSGAFEDWVALYNEYITPFTYVICMDGDYYHGAYTP